MSYYVCCVSYNNDKCDRSTYTKEEQGMRVIFSYKNFKQYMGGGRGGGGMDHLQNDFTSRISRKNWNKSRKNSNSGYIYNEQHLFISLTYYSYTYQVQKDQM